MNFRLIIFTCCCFLTIVCNGQQKKEEYTLNIFFYPSFISSSRLIIVDAGDSASMTLAVTEKQSKRALIKKSDIELLTAFLKSYKSRIKGSSDTIAVHKGPKGDTYYEVSDGTDGINVTGDFSENNIEKKFTFWSPKKGTENQKLIQILFQLMNNSFSDEATLSYLGELKEYF